MKLLILGDMHITKKAPQNRLDNYWETVERKLKSIFQIAIKNNVKVILQPGDLFDSANVSLNTIGIFAGMVKEWQRHSNGKFFSICGQHDLLFHNLNNPNTPHELLCKAGLMFNPCSSPRNMEGIDVYGADWGSPIPIPKNKKAYNILLIHKMIIQSKNHKLWPGQEEYGTANSILTDNKYDIIISGDNHQSFIMCIKDRYLFNNGSLLRTTIRQGTHKPYVIIVDTAEDTKDYKKVFIPVSPFEQVMDIRGCEKEKETNDTLEKFIEELKITENVDYNYSAKVYEIMKKNKVNKFTKNIVEKILEETT